MARFQTAEAQARETIEQAAADQRRHVAHAAPGMRRRALQPEIVPGVQPARRVRRHHGEGVQHRRQIEFLAASARSDRATAGRSAFRMARKPARPRPSVAGPAAHFPDAAFDVARTDQQHAAQTVRVWRAVVVHPAMECLVHAHFERDVVAGGERAEPAGRQHEVHVGAFVVHVGDARGRGSIDIRGNRLFPRHAGEAGHVAGRSCLGRFGIKPALINALTLVVRYVTVPTGGPVLVPPRQPGLFVRRQIGFENIDIGTDMGIRIEELVSAACHQDPPVCFDGSFKSIAPWAFAYFAAAGER